MEIKIKSRITPIVPFRRTEMFYKNAGSPYGLKSYLTDKDILSLYEELFNRKAEDLGEAKETLERVYGKVEVNYTIMDDEDFYDMLDKIDSTNVPEEDEEILSAREKLKSIPNDEATELEEKELSDMLELYRRFYAKRENEIYSRMIHDYLNTMVNISYKEVEERYQNAFKDEKRKLLLQDMISREIVHILDFQRNLIIEEVTDCEIWRISILHNNTPYGSIMVFYKSELRDNYNRPYIMVQEITKYPIPMLSQMIFPEFKKYMPLLNAVILPIVEIIGKEVNAKVIYVSPLEDQARQLEKHYGFKKTNYLWDYPCNLIPKSFGLQRYYKEINYDE